MKMRLFSRPSPMAAAFILIVVSCAFGISHLAAADRTWNGLGTNNNWTTSSNWNSLAVVAGDSLFFAGTTRLTPSNDFTAGTGFSNLTFNAGAGAFTLNGNPITLAGNITNHQTISTVRIGFDLIPTSAAWIINVESNEFGSGSLTITGLVSGAAGLIKDGLGLLTLGGANTFTGAVTVAEGTLRVDHDSALGTTDGATTVNSGATLNVAAPNTGANGLDLGLEQIFVSGTGATGRGAIVSTFASAQINALQAVTLTGDTTFGGSGPWTVGGDNPGRWDIRGTPTTAFLSTGSQPYDLTKTGSNEVRLAGVTVDPALANIDIQQGALGIEGNTTTLGNPNHTLTVHPGATLELVSPTNRLNKQFVFNGDGVNPTVYHRTGNNTMGGPVTLSNDCVYQILNGTSLTNRGTISGSGGLTKTGGGSLRLTSTNTYNGDTRVNDGTLALIGGGSISNSAAITVVAGATLDARGRSDGTFVANSGQTLKGDGSVLGRLTIAPGATISPGDNTLGFILIESNGVFTGEAEMEINRTNTPTSDRVTGISTATYGGTLTVVNQGPPLQAGDCFTLFAATNYSGSFAVTNLPSLSACLAWDASTLAQNGRICVVALPPVITCPGNITTNILGTNVVVNYPAPTITNGTLVSCTPPSGSVFPLGTTLVTCSATNACGSNTCTFNVTVQQIPTNCLFFAGRVHCALGAAALNISSNRLLVSNLGTNGQDGVAVDIGQAHSWEAVLTNLDASILPTGAYLVVDTYGMLHGASLEQRICSTRIEDAGSVWQVSFDFSSLGAPTYTVEVRLNGVVVDSKTGVTGPAATITEPPIVDPVNLPKCPPTCIGIAASVGSPTPTNITILGHASVVGDQIFAYPDPSPPSAQADFFTRFLLTASHIPSFAIVQVTVVSAAPVITAQPQSLSVTQGGTATFTVAVNGNSPIFYQWRLNGTDIPGATNASFTITSAQTADAGFYTVVVTSAFGSTGSATRGLTVTLTDACCDNKVWFKEETYDGNTPPARSGHAMAYHNAAAQPVILMFGGAGISGNHMYNTWVWTGLNWFERTPFEFDTLNPVHSPTARRDHALAFLPVNGNRPDDLTILFGGFGGSPTSVNKNDTWGWNGNEWLNKTPGVSPNPPGPSPSPRRNHTLAYDGVNDQIMLFGGNDGAVRDDTWLFNGTTWTEVFPANRPPARQNHAAAYDADRNVVVIFGGDSGVLYGDTWEWDGTDWQNKTPGVNGNPSGLSPTPRRNAAMTYAGECGRISLFGGERPALSDEYWEREGTMWTLVPRAFAPSARAEHAAAFHDASHQFLIFGGNAPAADKETWAFGFERINNGIYRTDVNQLGITRELWQRDLTTRRFSWRKVGKFLNSGSGHHYFRFTTYTVNDPANTSASGYWPPYSENNTDSVYSQRRAKHKCNDDFTDCPDCTSGCIPENSDCRWHSEHMTLFQDYQLSGDFCQPVFVSIDFYNQGIFDARTVGTLYTDGVVCDFFNSPAIPTSGQLIACRQDRRSPAYTPHGLINTIKGKEGRVDTQWTVSLVGCGISAGLDELDPQCFGGGAGGRPCDIQYFEFGQDQSDLRFKLTTRGSGIGPATFCFYIDADNDSNTGSPGLPNYPYYECGADYRVCVGLTWVTNHAPYSVELKATTQTVECFNSCLDPAWQPTSFRPFNLRIGQTVLEVFVRLAGVGNPQGTYSAWVVSSDENGTQCGSIPINACETRMQLARKTETICPRVVVADPYAVTGLHILTDPVKVTFTEAMQPIVATDVQIVPPVPFTVSQDSISQRILSINPVGAWQPGKYIITLLPTIKDLSGNLLDGNSDSVCGDPYPFEFCVPDMTFYTTDDAPTKKQLFAAGENIYVYAEENSFPVSTTFKLYLVIDGNVDEFGKKLADWTPTGPHTVTTTASGKLLPSDQAVNLGQPFLAGNFKVVADLNHNGEYDAGDRVTGLCGPGLGYGEPCYSTIDDIVAWWPFEDAAISTAAELMNANQGALVGAGSSSGPGIVGKARFFNGLSTYLSVADDSTSNDPQLNFGTGNFSMEAWINTPPSDPVELPLVDKRSAGVNFAGYYWRLVNGQLSFVMGDLASVTPYGGVGVNVADGQWHHVGVTVQRSGSGAKAVKLYVDGQVQATGFPILGSVDNTAELRIGGNRAGDPPLYYIGGMDELELYDRALEPEEMLFIFNQRAAGKCTDAVAPSVAHQLTNATFTAGSQMRLSVSFTTGFPLTYQWYFNGVALTNGGTISDVTNNVLTIDPATLANAGSYSLVAGNFTGEETSQPIKVTVLPLITLNFVNTPTNITLLWSNAAYRLQVATDLGSTGSPTVWTNVPGSSPINQPLTGPRKFFRLISP